ncbi:MAG TPA: lysophospholipid acyltransferase family protein [Bacteroidota bacterium]|nr:lysophospholipid acyltransferase family protein [Bacteroidota bacterium]
MMRAILTLGRIIVILVAGFFLSVVALASVVTEKDGRGYFWAGSTWSKIALRVCGIDVRVRGREHLRPDGAYIFVTNHASMFDIPAIMSTLPRVRIMFKKELSYVPVWGWALRWGHHIMVDRGKGTEAIKSLERAAESIKSGGSVILFAEGTRTRDGKLLPFKRGAFALAAKSGVPIVPISINGSFKILPKSSLDIRPSPIELVMEAPIETKGISSREAEIEMMNKVRGIIERNYREDLDPVATQEKRETIHV